MKIRAHIGKKTHEFELEQGNTLMEVLIQNGAWTSAICGGMGKCGKCRVQIVSGAGMPKEAEKRIFTEKELKQGWRLACLFTPVQDTEIYVVPEEEHFNAVDYFEMRTGSSECSEETGYDVSVDIGTTTIALLLQRASDAAVLDRMTLLNRQRRFGADVISRIQASNEGQGEELQKLIREDLKQGIHTMIERQKISAEQIRRIVIAGNTTMGHLLMGYDCHTLGIVPFTPVNIDFISDTAKIILDDDALAETPVLLLPGISTYVGGDIVSGLYHCGFDKNEEIGLLIDLGTNGEMALGNKDKILVTSTAAGPVFEGGNIKWGVGSIDGAICSVSIQEEQPHIQTISDRPPVGICGTGVIETAAELFKEELLDEMGKLEDDYFEDGYPLAKTASGEVICLTQKDIRELQLAKSAIRAGLETLILKYGIQKEQITHVYLAGGFGFHLDKDKAILIGMLPEDFSDRIEVTGNSSLAGAAEYQQDPEGREKICHILQHAEEIPLSSDKDFNRLYMDYMFFGDDV